jgi:hypothetical protein
MIVSEGVDSEMPRKLPELTRYPTYTMASKQRKILLARGWRIILCSCDIMPLSFIQHAVDQMCVEGVAEAVSLDREL